MIGGGDIRRFIGERRGAALVEFTLMMPFLMVLAAGITEFGHALHQQHIIQKSLRDAARFAARTPYELKSCPLNTQPEWATMVSDAQTVALYGKLTPPSPPRFLLPNWSDATMVAVTESCSSAAGLFSPAGAGNDIPIITVSASVPFNSTGFLGFLGLADFNIQAQHSEMWVGL